MFAAPLNQNPYELDRLYWRFFFAYQKVTQLKALIEHSNSDALIEVDGGVTDKNIAKLSKAGVNAFVAGSFVFKSADPTETIHNLKNIVSK